VERVADMKTFCDICETHKRVRNPNKGDDRQTHADLIYGVTLNKLGSAKRTVVRSRICAFQEAK